MFFTPVGRLVQESVGRYSLYGTVVVPGNGLLIEQLDYSAPPGLAVPANFFPVQIILGAAETPAADGVLLVQMPLDFQATGFSALTVGGDTGMTHVMLIIVVGNAVVGTAVIRVPEPAEPIFPDVTPIPPCDRWSWAAWRSPSPNRFPPLHIQGYFEAESFGYVGELTVAVPQGIDIDELLMHLTFHAVDGVHARVRARIPVQYENPKPLHNYKRIQILYPSKASCQVPVVDLG
jgi:hypothetical protein